jgi:hypothetical protein
MTCRFTNMYNSDAASRICSDVRKSKLVAGPRMGKSNTKNHIRLRKIQLHCLQPYNIREEQVII